MVGVVGSSPIAPTKNPVDVARVLFWRAWRADNRWTIRRDGLLGQFEFGEFGASVFSVDPARVNPEEHLGGVPELAGAPARFAARHEHLGRPRVPRRIRRPVAQPKGLYDGVPVGLALNPGVFPWPGFARAAGAI